MVVAGLLILALAVTAAADTDKEKVYKTPQAVFEAAKTAAKKKDMRTFVGCLTPDSQKLFTGQLVLAGVLTKAFAGLDPSGKLKEVVKPIDDLMAKHGLTEEALKKFKPSKDPKETGKAMRAMADLIKDRTGFCVEIAALFEKSMPKKGKAAFENEELKDVKIDGDKAKGVLVSKDGEKERKVPIDFAKIGGGWKLVMPEAPIRPGPKEKPAKEG
jgi:hypothetical protein